MTVWKRLRLADISACRRTGRAEIRSRPDLRHRRVGVGVGLYGIYRSPGCRQPHVGYGGEDEGAGQYHSIYDDFYYYTHFMDTDFATGACWRKPPEP